MWRLSLLVVLSPLVSSTLLGWVESPGYPKGYPSYASLNWSRCAPKGHVLSIQLIHLDLEDSHECENDAVQVFSNGNLISLLCGKRSYEELQTAVNPQLWSVSGGCLSLHFHSDFSNHHRHSGFRGFYTLQDYDECEDLDVRCTQFCHNFIGGYYCSCNHGYHLDTDNHTCTVSCAEDLSGQTEGSVSSPSWPGLYPENSHCVHSLSVDPKLQLQLTFSKAFDVEQSPDGDCLDSLRIETHSGTLGPFCGSTPPASPLRTHSHQIKIHFETDGYGANHGFSRSNKVCLPTISPLSSLTPHKAEYSPGEKVTVTCDTGHYVSMPDRKQKIGKEYETTCQSTGDWKPQYICQPPDLYKSQITFNCSSSYYYLKGKDTYTCGTDGEWISSDNDIELPKCIAVCGKTQKSSVSTGKILGGEDAELGQIPWYLLIKRPRRGGASLINDRWAVTAAHVVEGFENSPLLWLGSIVNGSSNQYVSLQSEKIIIHPNYIKGLAADRRTNFDNDIALIRFSSRVELGPNISPICLSENSREVQEGNVGTIAGFGVESTKKRAVSRILQHAPINVISEQRCRDTPRNGAMRYTSNMFCAGAEGKDSCEKDSGGPFFAPPLGRGRGRISSWGLCLGARLVPKPSTEVTTPK
ncbi:hypothetical protein WMY93_026519 [Mugilogobius chulae]|uniref:Complement subcomponent C1r n=1 Tax=Mugilogobius chulae TaxID=88201 RepID=A0AAW0N276_9GOBI